jgi:hypothetical protein
MIRAQRRWHDKRHHDTWVWHGQEDSRLKGLLSFRAELKRRNVLRMGSL